MKSKFLSILLCVCILMSLSACKVEHSAGEPTGDGSELETNFTGQVDITEPIDNIQINEYGRSVFKLSSEGITPNGELPDNIYDCDPRDLKYYSNIVVNALIELDIETLAEYIPENDLISCKGIKEDERKYDIYKRVIGNLTYLPSTMEFFGKTPKAMGIVWYTDQYKNQVTTDKNAAEMSYEELIEVYDKYYAEVPCTKEGCGIIQSAYIENGRICFKIEHAFKQIGINDLNQMSPGYFEEGVEMNGGLGELMLSMYMCGDHIFSYDYIFGGGTSALYDAIVSNDLDKLVAIIDGNDGFWDDTWYDEAEYIKYFKNDDMRKKLQEFIKQNVIMYRNYHSIIMWCRMNGAEYFDDTSYSYDEALMLNSIEWYDCVATNAHDYGSAWIPAYQEIIEWAEQAGALQLE